MNNKEKVVQHTKKLAQICQNRSRVVIFDSHSNQSNMDNVKNFVELLRWLFVYVPGVQMGVGW